jgi:hypothetical protein
MGPHTPPAGECHTVRLTIAGVLALELAIIGPINTQSKTLVFVSRMSGGKGTAKPSFSFSSLHPLFCQGIDGAKRVKGVRKRMG